MYAYHLLHHQFPDALAQCSAAERRGRLPPDTRIASPFQYTVLVWCGLRVSRSGVLGRGCLVREVCTSWWSLHRPVGS
eukprot:5950131-Pyramimonas_sp.AAC.1